MKRVGARELRENAGKVLRRVREGRETIEITWPGRAIARLVPVLPAKADSKKLAKIWSDLDSLSEEIGAQCPKGVSAAAALSSR